MKMARDIGGQHCTASRKCVSQQAHDSRRSNMKSRPSFHRHFQANGSPSDGTLESPLIGAVGEIHSRVEALRQEDRGI